MARTHLFRRSRPVATPPSGVPLETFAVPAPSAPRAIASLGCDAIDRLLADDDVSEILVNAPDEVWVERDGKLHLTEVRFADEGEVRRLIDAAVRPLGRRCDETAPAIDARLADGSRLHAIVPPLAVRGPALAIRKFARTPLGARDLVLRGTASAEVLALLRAAVVGRLNVLVSGGTGTGKTTLLNVLSAFIPDDERILTIETAAELQLQQRHVLALEARPADADGRGAVTVRDLVANALRMRPDRIVVGECRGGEALDMLQAMSSGHDGSLTTLHASSPRDALRRLETMVMMAGLELPLRAIRATIASAVHVIVQLERLADGSRRVVRVSEVTGMESEMVSLSDLFVFRSEGVEEGRVVGRLVPTGVRPLFLEALAGRGVGVPPAVFGVA